MAFFMALLAIRRPKRAAIHCLRARCCGPGWSHPWLVPQVLQHTPACLAAAVQVPASSVLASSLAGTQAKRQTVQLVLSLARGAQATMLSLPRAPQSDGRTSRRGALPCTASRADGRAM